MSGLYNSMKIWKNHCQSSLAILSQIEQTSDLVEGKFMCIKIVFLFHVNHLALLIAERKSTHAFIKTGINNRVV